MNPHNKFALCQVFTKQHNANGCGGFMMKFWLYTFEPTYQWTSYEYGRVLMSYETAHYIKKELMDIDEFDSFQIVEVKKDFKEFCCKLWWNVKRWVKYKTVGEKVANLDESDLLQNPQKY